MKEKSFLSASLYRSLSFEKTCQHLCKLASLQLHALARASCYADDETTAVNESVYLISFSHI